MAVHRRSCICYLLSWCSKSKSSPIEQLRPIFTEAATSPPNLDPSVPSPDGTCHILRLPLELLDEIYRIVLTEDDGLYSIPTTGRTIAGGFNRQSTKLFTCACAVQEANRLKYVCRQMWLQTRGLGLRFNVVHFYEGSERVSVSEQFFRFTDFCSPANKRRIQAILHETQVFDSERYKPWTWEQMCEMEITHTWRDCLEMHSLIDFCWTYPNARIIYRPAALSLNDHPFLFVIKACVIAQTLRGSLLQPMLLPNDDMFDVVERCVEKLQAGRESSVLDAPNFRVLPVEEDFTSQLFLFGINDGSAEMHANVWMTVGNIDGGVQTLLEWVSEWYERGI